MRTAATALAAAAAAQVASPMRSFKCKELESLFYLIVCHMGE